MHSKHNGGEQAPGVKLLVHPRSVCPSKCTDKKSYISVNILSFYVRENVLLCILTEQPACSFGGHAVAGMLAASRQPSVSSDVH